MITTMGNRRSRFALALAVGLAAGCGPTEEERAAAPAEAVLVVEQFGDRLKHVSLLAPADSVQDQIREQYGAYLTTLQLGGWLSDPASAPGRETSSPWPDRIEVRDAQPIGRTAFDVTGDIVYVTSVEGDVMLRTPVTARVVRGPDDIWRISEWTQGR